jgi:hypothetical protein
MKMNYPKSDMKDTSSEKLSDIEENENFKKVKNIWNMKYIKTSKLK